MIGKAAVGASIVDGHRRNLAPVDQPEPAPSRICLTGALWITGY